MVNKNDDLYPLFLKKIMKQRKPFILSSTDRIVGNSLCIGKPGNGKTTCNRREAECRWELNHKIFCLYDAGRMDLAYFLFPSVSDFWKAPKLENNKIVAKRKYPSELLYPVVKSFPEKIPNHGVPFTIPVSDLDEDDIIAMVGDGSKDTIRGAFAYMEERVTEETTPEEYLDILTEGMTEGDEEGIKLGHYGVKKLRESVFKPLIYEGLLSNKKANTALDIEKLIKDKKTMSILVLKHTSKRYWGFLVHYFMNHIFKTLSGFGKLKGIKQKTTIILNEVVDILSENEEDKGTSAYAVSRMLSKINKQWRTGNIFSSFDTQLPSELPKMGENISRVYVFKSSIPSVLKAMEICGMSKLDIDSDDLQIIPRLAKGWYYLLDNEKGVSIHKLEWCRSRTYLDGEDFYDIYDDVYGKTSYRKKEEVLKELNEQRESNAKVRNIVREIKKAKKNKKRKLVKEEINPKIEKDEIGLVKIKKQKKNKEVVENIEEVIEEEDDISNESFSNMSYKEKMKIFAKS